MSIIAPTLAETSSRRQGGMKGEKESATYDGVWHDSQKHSPKVTTLQCRPDFWSTHDSILFRPSSGSLQQVPAPPPLSLPPPPSPKGGEVGFGEGLGEKKVGLVFYSFFLSLLFSGMDIAHTKDHTYTEHCLVHVPPQRPTKDLSRVDMEPIT